MGGSGHSVSSSGVGLLVAKGKIFVTTVFGWGKLSPYFLLLVSVAMAYFPFGMILLMKMKATSGDDPKAMDNVDPREGTLRLVEKNKMAAHCKACHEHLLEGYPFFAAGVLSALQAGCSAATVSAYALFHCIVRAIFTCAYCFNNDNVALSVVRTAMFAFNLGIVGRLFYMAAWEASDGSLFLSDPVKSP